MKYQYIPQIVWHNYFIWNHMCYCFKKWIHQSQYSTDIITHRNMNSTDWMLFKNFILIVKLHSYLFNKWMKWEIVRDKVAQNRKLRRWFWIIKFMKKFEYFIFIVHRHWNKLKISIGFRFFWSFGCRFWKTFYLR